MANLMRKVYLYSPSISGNRMFSVTSTNNKDYSCKLLVVGGGSGGCTIASKFTRRLGKDAVVVLEPSEDHYYQPLWTLVGAGIKKLKDTHRSEKSVLPASATWVKDHAKCIDPDHNQVTTVQGHTISYEYLVVAVGLVNDYDKVPGLCESLLDKNSGVSTIYSPEYCEKTWHDFQRFKGGNAIFTYPDSLIKCPGAPQKIAYLADSYFNKTQVRSKSKIYFNTSLPVIFGIPKYANALQQVIKRKNIDVNYKTVLKEIKMDCKEAVFVKHCDDTLEEFTMPYNLLHVTPAMSTPEVLRNCPKLVNEAGYLTVDKFTLKHCKYPNVYGLGDCTDTPNSKTAAAIAKQSFVLEHNLLNTMKCVTPDQRYNGYGACPLVTSYNTCILAEFLYDGVVHETFPFDQVNARESKIAYYMKRDLFPFIYWHGMLKGYYHGPEFLRKLMAPIAKLFK